MGKVKQIDKGGRPPQYTEWLKPDKLKLLEEWASEGLTNEEIAKYKMGISERTFYQWQADHSQFAQAIKKGRVFCVLEVENALYRAAIGYEVEETITETITEEGGFSSTDRNAPTVRTRTQTRHIPPNVAAAIFYLKNRAPDRWMPDNKLVAKSEGDDGAERPQLIINYNYQKAEPDALFGLGFDN
ncbi:MAG: hypothetical protein ACOX6O_06930 [Christensenellales bacterium]